MRISLSEIERIEKYIQGELSQPSTLHFRAQLLTDPLLRLHVTLQKRIYTLVKAYCRKQLKEEFRQAHNNVLEDYRFEEVNNTVHNLFKK